MRRGEGDEQKDDTQQSIKVYATISADATETNLIDLNSVRLFDANKRHLRRRVTKSVIVINCQDKSSKDERCKSHQGPESSQEWNHA